MHSLAHIDHAHADATERLRRAQRVRPGLPRDRPPPRVRGRLAYVVGRLATRLDRESARRATA